MEKPTKSMRPDVRALLETTSRLNPKLRARITLAPVTILRTPPVEVKPRKMEKSK